MRPQDAFLNVICIWIFICLFLLQSNTPHRDDSFGKTTIHNRGASAAFVGFGIGTLENHAGVRSNHTERPHADGTAQTALSHARQGRSLNPFIADRHINEKERNAAAEKLAISRHAASMISSGESIMIASGTTMHFLAREIKPLDRLDGGYFRSARNHDTAQRTLLGRDTARRGGTPEFAVGRRPYAEQMLDNFLCSKLFLGVDGIDFEFGLTTTNLMEASLNRAMMRAAQQTIVLGRQLQVRTARIQPLCAIDAVNEIINGRRRFPTTSLPNRGLPSETYRGAAAKF